MKVFLIYVALSALLLSFMIVWEAKNPVNPKAFEVEVPK